MVAPEKSRLLRFLSGLKGTDYAHDPRELKPSTVARWVEQAGRLFGPGKYFGLDVQGLERVPDRPCLIVANHSGGTSIPDVWGLAIAWYRHFGVERPIHTLAHEIIVSTAATGRMFGSVGVLRANPRVGREVLTRFGRDLLVMPGGDRDTWRPYSKRYEVTFAGRTGYARLALRAGVPIVPVANAGAHETLIVLTDGQRLARAIGLQRFARSSVFPIHLSLPWGLAIGPWPHLPIPRQLRYRIGPPIEPPAALEGGGEPTPKQIQAHDRKVRRAMQDLLDGLRAEERG